MDGYETVNVRVDLDAGTLVPRHTHPGIESSYVVEGALELSVDGVGTRTLNAGDGFQVPTRVPHGGKDGDKPTIRLAGLKPRQLYDCGSWPCAVA